METEEAIKSGQLYAPSQGFLKKSWHKRFYALYKASKHGIQRLEVFDTEENFYRQSPNKIIPLTDCIKVTPAPQKQQANVFEIRRKNHAYLYSAETFQEMTEWVSALQDAAFGPARSSSGVTLSSILGDSSTNSIPDVVKQEENMIYSSVDAPEIYHVKIMDSEASLRCGLAGEYRLLITPVNISVAEETSQGQTGRILYTWPYRHIRRYGCSKELFSLEAGRKCSSGEGLFCFEAKDGNLIFQSVASHVSSLKASQNELDSQASPSPKADQTMFFGNNGRQSFSSVENAIRLSPASARHADVSAIPKENEDSFNLQDVPKPHFPKPLPPVAKPPRKSKSLKSEDLETASSTKTKADEAGNPVAVDAAKPSLSPSGSHLYEDPVFLEMKGAIRKSPQPQEVLYDEPQELTEAWKIYGRDVDETEGEDAAAMKPQESPSPPEPLYAVLEEDPEAIQEQTVSKLALKLKHVLPLKEGDQNIGIGSSSAIVMDPKPSQESDHYDHLGIKKPNTLRFASLNPENQHVYGKLVSPRQGSITPTSMALSKQPALDIEYSNVGTATQYAVLNIAGSKTGVATPLASIKASAQAGHRDYENIGFSSFKPPAQNEAAVKAVDPKQDLTPAHFVHNDVEYAQVQKRTMK